MAVLGQRIMQQIEDFNQYTTRIYGGTGTKSASSPSRWCAPLSAVMKLNTNASVGEEGWIGLGVVACDSAGRVAFSVVRRVRAFWPPKVTECKAIHVAVRLAKAHGLVNVIIESDSQVVTTRLTTTACFLLF